MVKNLSKIEKKSHFGYFGIKLQVMIASFGPKIAKMIELLVDLYDFSSIFVNIL